MRLDSLSTQSTSSASTGAHSDHTIASQASIQSSGSTPPTTYYSSSEKGTPEKQRARQGTASSALVDSINQKQESPSGPDDPVGGNTIATLHKAASVVSAIFDCENKVTNVLSIFGGYLIFEPEDVALKKRFSETQDPDNKPVLDIEDPEVDKYHIVLPVIAKMMIPQEVAVNTQDNEEHPQSKLIREAEVYGYLQQRNTSGLKLAPKFYGFFDDETENNALFLVLEDCGEPLATFDCLTNEEYVLGKSIRLFSVLTDPFCRKDTLLKKIDALHRLGVIHGRIQPWNVLQDPETKEVVLIDFATADIGIVDLKAYADELEDAKKKLGPS
jgi:hypothetical protein